MNNEIVQLLSQLGPGKMSATAYDTAWVARLGEIDSGLSNHAMEWLIENQLSDGSWGAAAPLYYHDRVISTLAAMIALTKYGRRALDRQKIEVGLAALDRITAQATKGLRLDPNGATIGFEMIVPILVAEAEELGIIRQQGERILGRLGALRKIKLNKMLGLKISRQVTMAFSAEMAGLDGQTMLDAENIQEANGSVGHSPSATAYFARYVRPGDERSIKYLRSIISPDGSFPNLYPFEIYERAWVLWNLSLIDLLPTATLELFEPFLDNLQQAWHPEKGISLSAGFTVPDGDNTSVVFDLLSQHNRNINVGGLLSFYDQDHFRCYDLEANPSISVNIHALGALKRRGYLVDDPMVKNVLAFLKKGRTAGGFWFDKWHISPFYTTAHAIITGKGYCDDLIEQSVKWIISAQQANGSWGYYLQTAEETAYCLQALSIYRRRGGRVSAGILKKGVDWLTRNQSTPYPLFWIGKGLYAGDLVVRSAILSAIMLVNEM